MPVTIDLPSLLLCITAPQHEHQMLTLAVENIDDPRGKGLPTPIGMRPCLPLGHGQHRVEQQYALISPALKISVSRNWMPQIALDLLVDILQRRRRTHPGLYGETQT